MDTTLTRRRRPLQFTLLAALSLAALIPALARPAAARPSAMKLFPEETLLFVRAANARELVNRFQDTSVGRMFRDPQLQPFIAHLYGSAEDLYAEHVQGVLGLSLEQLQHLPQGEIAFGLVPDASGEPQPLVLIDVGEESDSARQLIEAALDKAREEGGETHTEKVGDLEVTVLDEKGGGGSRLAFFWKENTLLGSTKPELLPEVLRHWDASPNAPEAKTQAETPTEESADPPIFDLSGRTLAENHNFATILLHSRREQDPPPHLLFYADPIGFVHAIAKSQPQMRIAEAMLPALGLDGVLGMGGTVTYATGQFDDLSHMHLLLGNPRAGVVQLLAFEPGDMTPQDWVPLATESYLTGHWDFRAFYDRLAAIIDGFRGAGATDEFVAERFSKNLGVDVLTDIIANLDGRVTYVIGYEKPATFRSQKQVLALGVIDEAAAIQTLDTIRARFPDLFKEHTFGKATYYALMPKWMEALPEDQRPFAPMLAIMDGTLFVGASTQLFERCVAARDGTADRLVDSNDYVRVRNTLSRETRGKTPVGFVVGRMEESLRHWYELLTSEDTRQYLDEHAEGNPIFAALVEALEANELPPFDVLVHYMSPNGGILYDTDNGLHLIGFTLRNESQ